jgi:hypothetical protein
MIEVGDVVTLSTKVYNGATPPALEDGGAVTCTVTSEIDNVSLSVTPILHPGTGQYSGTFTVLQPGAHDVVWTVTGANAGTLVDVFVVEQPMVGIVGLAETKAYLRITRTNDDEILRSLILTASDLCEGPEGTGRTWRRTVVTGELVTGTGDSIVTARRPVKSLTALSIDGVAQTVGSYDVDNWRIYNPNGVFSSSTRLRNVVVSYVAGGDPVPAGVRDGVLEMVRHLYAMHRGGSNLPRQEEPDYTESAGYLIPNRVKMAWQQAQVGL